MTSEADALITAYKLAILAFYTGVLIYALPIPLPGLKRWAPTLMADALLAAILSLIFFTLFDASDRIAATLGGSWELFQEWYEDSFSIITGIKTTIVSIYSIPDPSGALRGIRSLLSPVDKAVTAALLFLLTVGGIAWLVKVYGTILAAIGVALYAVPFRILRGAGAWLLAFALVFNAGLQVLPLFLVTIADAPGSPVNPSAELRAGLVFREVRVENLYGDPIPGGILLVYNASGGDVIASYLVNDEGYAVTSSGDTSIPLPSQEVWMELRSGGVIFPLDPDTVDPREGQVIEVSSPHIFWSPGILQYAYTVGYVHDAYNNGSTATFTIELYAGEYVEVRYPAECPAYIDYEGLDHYQGSLTWMGVDIEYVTLTAIQYGIYNITLSSEPCSGVDIDAETQDYWTGTGTSFVDYNILAAFILYYFTLPMAFIFILFIATAGVAKLLGGRDRLPLRIV